MNPLSFNIKKFTTLLIIHLKISKLNKTQFNKYNLERETRRFL